MKTTTTILNSSPHNKLTPQREAHPHPDSHIFYSIASTSNISDFYETGFNDNQLNNCNGEFGASKMYWEPTCESDNYDVRHSDHAATMKESCPSDGYFTDAPTVSTTEVSNYLEPSPPQVRSQKPRDTHAHKSSVENKRLSNRFFPGYFVSEKNYPSAARAPSSANQSVAEQCCMWSEEIWRVH